MLGRKNNTSPGVNLFLSIIIGLLMCGFGFYTLFSNISEQMDEDQFMKKAVEVDFLLTNKTQHYKNKEYYYDLDIYYEYNGEEYTGVLKDIAGTDAKNATVGYVYACYIDPDNPTDCRLETIQSSRVMVYIQNGGIGFVGLLLLLGGIFTFVKSKKSASSTTPASPYATNFQPYTGPDTSSPYADNFQPYTGPDASTTGAPTYGSGAAPFNPGAAAPNPQTNFGSTTPTYGTGAAPFNPGAAAPNPQTNFGSTAPTYGSTTPTYGSGVPTYGTGVPTSPAPYGTAPAQQAEPVDLNSIIKKDDELPGSNGINSGNNY